MTIDGILDDMFYNFVERNLLPHLLPFNGVNRRSVVILDNASIHHVVEVEALIEETGAIVIYLPPYSPDFNPIEECFSKIKSFLKANSPLIQISSDSEMEDIILASFANITAEDCHQWSGYLQ